MEENHSMIMLKPEETSSTHGSTITFKSINYTLYSQKNIIHSCLKHQEKQILFDLNGIFKPGMNAILGPTGSGKSTLLDILANRKTRDGLSGEVFFRWRKFIERILIIELVMLFKMIF